MANAPDQDRDNESHVSLTNSPFTLTEKLLPNRQNTLPDDIDRFKSMSVLYLLIVL